MNERILSILSLAFRELRRFSIPGMGTFVRETEPSRFDAQTGLMYPPRERFRYEAGGLLFVEPLVNLAAQNLTLGMEEARAFVEDLGATLAITLDRTGALTLPNAGLLVKDAAGQLTFEMMNVDNANAPAFELPPIKLHQPNTTVTEKNIPMNSTASVNAKAAAAPANGAKSKKTPVWAIAAVFAVALIGGGLLFKDKIMTAMSGSAANQPPPEYQEVLAEDSLRDASGEEEAGMVVDTADGSAETHDERTSNTPASEPPTKRAPANVPVAAPVTAHGGEKKAPPKAADKDKKPEPAAAKKPVVEIVRGDKKTPASGDKKPVVEIMHGDKGDKKPAAPAAEATPKGGPTVWKPSANLYYLIAEGAASKEDAESKRKAWIAKGYSAQILDSGTGTFRIGIFQSSEHKAVANKLTQLKGSGVVRSDAWILKPNK